MKKLSQGRKGFTLIEILLVVAAIGILASIVILAINPNKQLGETRNAERHSDVTTILNAVYQYSVDNNGTLPSDITLAPKEICNTTGATCSSASLVDLGVLFMNQKYLTSIPIDPKTVTLQGAGYFINKSADNRITVSAPLAEQSATISVTR